jgi:hypothetical protein
LTRTQKKPLIQIVKILTADLSEHGVNLTAQNRENLVCTFLSKRRNGV